MKAIILAAGIASRLRPLTDNCPKCLLEINNKSILERTIESLIINNIKDITIVTGYLNHMIEEFIKSKFNNLNITFIKNETYDSTNNIYSLWLALKNIEDEVILLDSDIIYDPKLIEILINSKEEDVLLLNNHTLGEEEIKIIVNNENKITEISKVCDISKAIGESIGIERMSKTYIKNLKLELDKMIVKENLINVFYELAFERLIDKGYFFSYIDTSNYFSMELDTVEDFNEASNIIKK
ncbi:phosphocholine cytidylyltransferase family protein [Marinilabiliaceae bacterium JC040]|nr:phosphocholine cytidylyltransferase family protein [Marinilabiliaceae bacterium JC040]